MMDHVQIRKLRADLGVSQAALARAAGINRTVLSGFETGQLTLKGDCARRLEDFFASRDIDIALRPPAPDAQLLAELRWIEQRISEIEHADCDKGFFETFMEREREEREALLCYLTRWRVLMRARQGSARADAPVPKKPVTQADYLAFEYLKLRQKGRKRSQLRVRP